MNDVNLESKIIRAVWSSVEAINSQVLLQLNDSDLIQQIIKQVDQTSVLSWEERLSLINYTASKVMLIRDIAAS
jgi:hypothetical protein